MIREAPVSDLLWLATRARIDITPTLRAMEIVSDQGRILGMVGFDGWAPNSCMMHIALDVPSAGRHLICPAFHAVFDPDKFNLGVAVGVVKSTNKKALRLNEKLGFRVIFMGRDWFEPGVHQVWMEMRREECRWLSEKRKAA